MTINFHDANNKQSYTTRAADKDWQALITKLLPNKEISHAADIGCGGGIYSKALSEMGIPKITGVDFSEAMLEGAKANCHDCEMINFKLGNAYNTGLRSDSYDLLLERALIHHLDDLPTCFSEAFRILNQSGTIIIQDRTPADCVLKGTDNHIRGYIFSIFPHLADLEVKRRYSSETVKEELNSAGFNSIHELKFWEIRKIYTSKNELLTDLRTRNGRSILHELSDNELEQLIGYIDSVLNCTGQIIEKDRWTIWVATKNRGRK
ncbi:methyltransferase domain-containing protein [Virgibacillus oceani]|uniref:SAM-dependent methyltransferase n=1 Tax=Virgibacillus oceani TaxID=1479511 RepID=A0A917HMN3_9BACI|nr:methyltransferase domain-containing protein [Virgibacillus oceani]GGG83366.1 SAM-dependent methyltransferase [Virgibacillus oceani]